MDISSLVSRWQGWQGANFAGGLRGPRDMNTTDILSAVAEHKNPGRRAVALDTARAELDAASFPAVR